MFKSYFFTLFLILFSCFNSYSQQYNEDINNNLIIGELRGRVDHTDIEQLLKTNYYPISRTPNKTPFRIIKNSSFEVIFEYVDPLPLQSPKIIFRFFSSELALIASLITDEIDFAKTESAYIAEEVHKSNPVVRVLFQNKPANFVKMIAYNNRHSIFKNRNVRRALSYAINKQYILTKLLNNQASIASGPVDKESKLYTSEFKEYKTLGGRGETT